MKKTAGEPSSHRSRWFPTLRLLFREIRLRLHLRSSRHFKAFCEKRGCPHLANLEQEYMAKLQNQIIALQQQRAALKVKTHEQISASRI
jgi:hypothetical protein